MLKLKRSISWWWKSLVCKKWHPLRHPRIKGHSPWVPESQGRAKGPLCSKDRVQPGRLRVPAQLRQCRRKRRHRQGPHPSSPRSLLQFPACQRSRQRAWRGRCFPSFNRLDLESIYGFSFFSFSLFHAAVSSTIWHFYCWNWIFSDLGAKWGDEGLVLVNGSKVWPW